MVDAEVLSAGAVGGFLEVFKKNFFGLLFVGVVFAGIVSTKIVVVPGSEDAGG